MAPRRGAANEQRILEALTASERPLSAYDLLAQMRPHGIAAPPTVYRALEKLVAGGKVHRIESLNAFVACRTGAPGDAHAHDPAVGFTICDGCGRVEEFVDSHLSGWLRPGLAARDFAPRSVAFEVRGLCGTCRAAQAPLA